VKATRAAFLLLPLAGVFAVDGIAFDFHAIKFVALGLVAAAALAGAFAAGLFAWTNLSLPLWIFAGVRGIELLRAPPSGRALRWYALLLTLILAHHVIAAAAPRKWLARRLVPMLAGLGGVVATFALIQAVSDARQAHAFFANRNFAGAGLAMLLPYALAWDTKGRIPLVAIILAGLAATQSRGGMLAAACVLAWWGSRRLVPFRWLILAGLPTLVLALGIAFGATNTVRVRGFWYAGAIEIGVSRPVLGAGADGFAREYPPIRDREEHAISGGRKVHAVHNDFLEAWANGGILGVLAMLFLVVMAVRAARGREEVLCSWIAFLAASLVDLPWRDPGLLTIAFVGLSLVAERKTLVRWARPVAAAGLAIAIVFLPDAYLHWRADREFGRFLGARDPARLDAALGFERRHPGALIERSHPEDLDLLLEQEPHHGGAWHNRSLRMADDEAIALLRRVTREHDPHHTLTRIRLARLLLDRGERAEAVVVLTEASEADPRPVTPYVLAARALREGGLIERADETIDKIPPRRYTVEVVREMLNIELALLRRGLWDAQRLAYIVERMPAPEVQERIEAALRRGEQIVAAHPQLKLPRREGETVAEHIERVRVTKAAWKRQRDTLTEPEFREAFLMSKELCDRRPTILRLRQKARAARGLHDVERAGHFESQALYLEVLQALAELDPVTARKKLKEALRAYPDLLNEREVVVATKLFAAKNPEAKKLARELFADHATILAALGR
jgi:tetratricopeptide (TPR) repeat protein